MRKALQMGADAGVHVVDDAIHGSDAFATSLVLAEAIKKIEYDLVFFGMSSTDGGLGVVPTLVAERLGIPAVTFGSQLTVDGDTVKIVRDGDVATQEIEATGPVVVSVTDQTDEARYPSFKGIMAAKKKPVETWSLERPRHRRRRRRPRRRVDEGRVVRAASAAHRRRDRHRRGRRRHQARRVPRLQEVRLRRSPDHE